MSGLYEPLLRHALYPAYESGLRRRGTLRYLREYERSQWFDPERIQALQWDKLQRLIVHCWSQVPYYRAQWQRLGIGDPREIATPADYARLPTLGKDDIRANMDALVADDHRGRLLYKATGGSTGEPLRFGYTRESYERRIAVMHRGYGWAGWRMGERTLYLWGQPARLSAKDRLYHAAFNRRMLNAFAMDAREMPRHADAFARFRPKTVVSYVAPIVRLAEWLEAEGRRLPAPARILTAAEALHPSQRALLGRVFGCPVHDTYGCREFMLIASECAHGGLHLTADHLCVELGESIDGDSLDRISPDQSQASPRELIVTDLHNFGMPLLRYRNGDLATAAEPGPCACGRGLPRLACVDGRKLDALRTPDGRFVPGEFVVYAFLAAKGVARYQAVQRSADRIEMRVVRGDGFDAASLDLVRAELQRGIGPATTLEFVFIDEIASTPTGKHRVTVYDIP